MINTLQELYKMTKARKFPNRYAFYDAVTVKFLQPLQDEIQNLKEALQKKDMFFSEKLHREVRDLAVQLEASHGDRSLLERKVEVLQEQMRRTNREFTAVHSQHLALTDILRLLSLGAIDYHAVLGDKRQAEVRVDVVAASNESAEKLQREREKILAENARFRVSRLAHDDARFRLPE